MVNETFHVDEDLIADIAARFKLRDHNTEALSTLVTTLDDDFDATQTQVLDMATGAGKTYLMAAFIEYLREMGVRNVLVITPGLVVQDKTVQNFTFGATKYIPGANVPPAVITPGDQSEWTHVDHEQDFFGSGDEMQLFVFNIHQLLFPKDDEGQTKGGKASDIQRGVHKPSETHGHLYKYLAEAEDLVVIADEQHLYGASAQAYQKAIRGLSPAVVVGLTGSTDKDDHVIFKYPLYKAIQEGHVKQPVIAYRKNIDEKISEEQQLRDALVLLDKKQEAFNSYIQSNKGAQNLNAVLFVICPDVDDATQTTALLRTPEYFGAHEQVLQVDNKHNDATTLALLNGLDSPGSPVRAVVSVNKLREGWDVKNIAVMVARRAMASDVLTQQTMGRGLRLPFGKITGVPIIDQLDIISHKSFNRLAKSEDVLKAFGLQAAAQRPDTTPTPVPPRDSSGGTETSDGDNEGNKTPAEISTPAGDPSVGPDEGAEPPEATGNTGQWDIGGIRGYEYEDEDELGNTPEPVQVSMTAKFAGTHFLFPTTAMARENRPFLLRDISLLSIAEAAKKITDVGSVLERDLIVFRKARRGMGLAMEATEQADVKSIPVTEEQAKNGLVQALFSMKIVERNSVNVLQAKRAVIPRLMDAAPVKTWTDMAVASAMQVLRDLVITEAKRHNESLKPEVTVHPKQLPLVEKYNLKAEERILDRISDRKNFTGKKHYGPWDKGLFEAASFDSYSGEYKLAELLNKSNEIVWWKRLYDTDKATIAWNVGRTYYPDFVALDKNDVYWILEGKAADKKNDPEVLAKEKAAQELITRLASEEGFEESRWGYLVAYEDSIAKSQTWAQVRESAASIKMPPWG